MKFVVKKCSDGRGRVGQLELPRLSREQVTYPTPHFFVHTVTGSIPHVTHEVLQFIFPNRPPPPIQVSVDSTYVFQGAIAESDLGIAKFVGLQDSPTLVTLLDPLEPFQSGFNDRSGLCIWPRFGRRNISIDSYLKIVASYKPSVFQCPTDYDVTTKTMDKRLKKSITRTVEYLEAVTTKTDPQSNNIFTTIEPSWFTVNPAEATKALVSILEKRDSIGGFMIRRNSEEPTEFVQLYRTIADKLPEDKVRYAAGALSLSEIVQLVLQGVDLFDTSICTELADAKKALILPNFEGIKGLEEELPQKNGTNGAGDDGDDRLRIFDMKDKRFFDDFKPLSTSCGCYTCRTFTRSYVHHLDATNELLGPVVLMVHNLYSFDRFFRVIRRLLDTEDSAGLRNLINQVSLAERNEPKTAEVAEVAN